MKKLQVLFLLPIFLYGCVPVISRPTVFTDYNPILISRANLTNSVSLRPVTNIGDPAKIYFKDGYIFISERFKGVHIIDNKNPSQPINKGYIAIPGCIDMAIKENILYVDNAIDLIAINLTEIEKGNLSILKRIENVFPEIAPPDGGVIPSKFSVANRPTNTIIIGWKN